MGTLHRDPQFGPWRARVRMLGAVLADLTPEFEQSLEARLDLWDRDEDESFRILGALQETVHHLLQRIEDDREDFEEYVVEALGEDLDEGLGAGFLATLERFKASFRHHEVAWNLLDSIDVENVSADEGPAAVDRKIERLEQGLAERSGSVRPAGPR